MIPNMFKIAGELTSNVIHVTARTHRHACAFDLRRPLATSWPAARPVTQCCASNSVQEAGDMALIAQIATLDVAHAVPAFLRRLPHLARDQQDWPITDETIRALIDEKLVIAHPRARAQPRPPDPARHGAESRRLLPGARSGQSLLPGVPEHRAERDGSLRRADRPRVSTVRLRGRAGCRARHRHHGLGRRAQSRRPSSTSTNSGEKVGLVKVRLYRPFAAEAFLAALPGDGQVHRRARPHQGAGQRSANRSTWMW